MRNYNLSKLPQNDHAELTCFGFRPFLQRDYVAQQTYDRLVMIESEENFKETLRSCASQPTLANQRTTVVEDFSEEFSERH